MVDVKGGFRRAVLIHSRKLSCTGFLVIVAVAVLCTVLAAAAPGIAWLAIIAEAVLMAGIYLGFSERMPYMV